ncbi:hypothetical protein Tco_0193360 [Tanacetum coccineum]
MWKRAITTDASLVAAQDNTQTRPETTSKTSRDLPPSEVNTSGRGEDSVEYHDDLTDFVPSTPYDSPLSGGSKDCSRQDDHQIEIEGQEARKEEKGKNSTTYEEKTFKGRVETSTDKSLGEDASKQERNDDKIEELNLTDGADT